MNRVTHFEIPSNDPEKAMNFYKNVFGWTYNRFGPAEYWLATTGNSKDPGIDGAIMKKMHPQQPVTNSIMIKNLDESIEKIKKEGGTIVVPKTEIPGVGFYAFFTDLDGNIMGVMEQTRS